MPSKPAFDRLNDRFSRNIYDTPKGQLRLALLQQDLAELLAKPGQLILDAGGGQGQFSLGCAQQGHQVVLCDISEAMLNRAQQRADETKLGQQLELHHRAIERFCNEDQRQFDLILCHAVLEWADDIELLLRALYQRLKPGGSLSLMYYNRHSIVLRNGLRGNFRKALSPNHQGDGSALTPTTPCDPEQVEAILKGLGMTLVFEAGVRCFYDYLPLKVRETYAFDDILELEQQFRQQLPYCRMARYIHLIAQKPDS